MCRPRRALAWPSRAPSATIGRPRARWRVSRTPCYRIDGDERRRAPHSLHALRRRNGDARSRPRHAVDARPVLGVQPVRPPLLDDVSAPRPREAQARLRTDFLRWPITILTIRTTSPTKTRTRTSATRTTTWTKK